MLYHKKMLIGGMVIGKGKMAAAGLGLVSAGGGPACGT